MDKKAYAENTDTITVYMPEALKQEFKETAQAMNISMSAMIKMLFYEQIKKPQENLR